MKRLVLCIIVPCALFAAAFLTEGTMGVVLTQLWLVSTLVSIAVAWRILRQPRPPQPVSFVADVYDDNQLVATTTYTVV